MTTAEDNMPSPRPPVEAPTDEMDVMDLTRAVPYEEAAVLLTSIQGRA